MERIWNPSQSIHDLQIELDAERCKALALREENEKLGFALIEWTELQNAIARLRTELDGVIKERDRWAHTIGDIYNFVRRQGCKNCRKERTDEDGLPYRHATCIKWMRLEKSIEEAMK